MHTTPYLARPALLAGSTTPPSSSSSSGRTMVSPLLAVLTQLEQAVNPGGRLNHVKWEFKDVVVRRGVAVLGCVVSV